MNRSLGHIYLVALAFLLACPIVSASCIVSSEDDLPSACRYGLGFRSHRYSIDERTSLNLTPDRHLRFPKGFKVSFDLCLNEESDSYGYVMRLVSGGNSSLDINSNVKSGNFNFVLVSGYGSATNISFRDALTLHPGEWFRVEVTACRDSILCSAAGVTRVIHSSLSDLSDIEIYFGMCPDERFYSSDVPPMTLRNIEISSAKGKVVRRWSLSRNNGTEVYDEISSARASVTNGIWEIDRHTMWTPILSEEFSSHPQVAYDPSEGHLYVATEREVAQASLENGTLKRMPLGGGSQFVSGGSQLIYDSSRRGLLSYSVQFPDFTHFDFSTLRWSSSARENVPLNQQHCRWFDPQSRKLYVFGGYGNHLYNANFYSRSIDSPGWECRDLSGVIYPRYLAAMGREDDCHLLVLGGYGNPSGLQEESPWNLYDLSRIDTRTGEASRVADFSLEGREHCAMASSLVTSLAEEKIYSLCFDNGRSSTSLNLFSVPLKGGEAEFLGAPIPYSFHDVESYSALYFSPDSTGLYAVVSNAHDSDGKYLVEVYSIAYPPLPTALVRQRKDCSFPLWAVLTLAALGLAALGFVCVWCLQRRKKLMEGDMGIVPSEDVLDPFPAKKDANRPSTVSLLGGLAVIDSRGNNITTEFTPVVRQLLLLILMNSGQKPVGITSEVLDDVLWYGMEHRQAANNRNVNIRKLRLRLEGVWDAALSCRNSYWSFDLEDISLCDYLEVRHLMDEVLSDPSDRDRLLRLLSLILSGPLLPDNDFEWLMDYKSRYSNMVIEGLSKIRRHYENDYDILILIARAMRVQDSIDEEAVRIYCRALYLKGNRSLSRSVWDKFTGDYQRIMGTLPDFSYSQIIGDV